MRGTKTNALTSAHCYIAGTVQ